MVMGCMFIYLNIFLPALLGKGFKPFSTFGSGLALGFGSGLSNPGSFHPFRMEEILLTAEP